MHKIRLFFAMNGLPDTPEGAHGISCEYESPFLPRVGESFRYWDGSPVSLETGWKKGADQRNGIWKVYSVEHHLNEIEGKKDISYYVTLVR